MNSSCSYVVLFSPLPPSLLDVGQRRRCVLYGSVVPAVPERSDKDSAQPRFSPTQALHTRQRARAEQQAEKKSTNEEGATRLEEKQTYPAIKSALRSARVGVFSTPLRVPGVPLELYTHPYNFSVEIGMALSVSDQCGSKISTRPGVQRVPHVCVFHSGVGYAAFVRDAWCLGVVLVFK